MTTSTSTALQHPKEFFRLMGLPLPFEGLHQHYVDMLCRHDANWLTKIQDFNEYVDWCSLNGHVKPSAYRIDHAMQRFIEWAKEVNPMANGMLENPKALGKMDKRRGMNGKLLLSLDISSANYSTMRWMAERQGIVVPPTWNALCAHLDIHPFLANCKIFRQYCFGNYMPNRYSVLQKHVMYLLSQGLELTDESIVFVSHDEIVVEYPLNEGYDAFMSRVKQAIAKEGLDNYINIKGTVYRTFGINDSLLAKAVNGESIEGLLKKSEDQRTDSVLRVEYPTRNEVEVGVHEEKKVLVGVSSNKFYAYFRIIMLNEPLQESDLMFQHEGMTAKWLLKDVKEWPSNSRTQ